MNDWKALDRLLQTDPRDAGCDETMEPLHVYAELVAIDRAQTEQRYPEVAAHLRSRPPCGNDLEGLLAAIRGEAAG
jgi:hypothetical protein